MASSTATRQATWSQPLADSSVHSKERASRRLRSRCPWETSHDLPLRYRAKGMLGARDVPGHVDDHRAQLIAVDRDLHLAVADPHAGEPAAVVLDTEHHTAGYHPARAARRVEERSSGSAVGEERRAALAHEVIRRRRRALRRHRDLGFGSRPRQRFEPTGLMAGPPIPSHAVLEPPKWSATIGSAPEPSFGAHHVHREVVWHRPENDRSVSTRGASATSAICCVGQAAGDLLGEALQRRCLSRLAPPWENLHRAGYTDTPTRTPLLTCGVPAERCLIGHRVSEQPVDSRPSYM